jgi:hypothetical protein
MRPTSTVLILLCVVTAYVCGSNKHDSEAPSPTVVIDALRKRLVEVSNLLRDTRPLSPSETFKLGCSCEDYCTGRCFSMMCSPCAPSIFSFPGGESLCLSVGPLGTGLLCHVDPRSGNITDNACCNEEGPTCWLPQDSCCASGDCSTCPTSHYANNLTNLYPPLQRVFVNSTCKSTA